MELGHPNCLWKFSTVTCGPRTPGHTSRHVPYIQHDHIYPFPSHMHAHMNTGHCCQEEGTGKEGQAHLTGRDRD